MHDHGGPPAERRAWGLQRSSAFQMAVGLAILVVLAAIGGRSAAAQNSAALLPVVLLDISAISLTERADSTDITVTATLREAAAVETTVMLDLGRSPLLTPGVQRAAVRDLDYTSTLGSGTNVVTIGAGSVSGQTTFAIDPTFDLRTEGDEAIIVIGVSAAGAVAPTDLIIEDGPYLSFPKSVYGHLFYPDQLIAVTVDQPVNASGGTASYSLSRVEPEENPLGLAFDPDTGRLTGRAAGAGNVPDGGLTTRYTITASDSAGHEATTLISIAIVPDICGSTTSVWFGDGEPPAGLTEDCNVLLASRDDLSGENGNLNWSVDTPIEDWDGLIEFHTDWKQIRKIELQGRGLNGTIPAVLGHLGAPSSLDLVLGDDYRESPDDRMNRLSGPIPPELGIPANLVVLALGRNNLSGPIPRELTNLDKLRSIYLYESPEVTGTIPVEFGDLPFLRNMTITDTGASGYVPWQLGKNVSSGEHPGLQVLNLSGHSLKGRIPWQLSRFGKIQQLALSDNQLVGGIPWQMGRLGNEEVEVEGRKVDVHLGKNQLTGGIPAQLGDIANLRVLSLSENRLTGHIPSELGNLKKLEYLYLRDNRLSGPIPAVLGNLSELKELHLYNNQLNGPIPSELGSLEALQQLELQCNDLSGGIPDSLANTALSTLHVQGNPELRGSPPGLTVVREGDCPGEYRLDVTVWRSIDSVDLHYVITRPVGQGWSAHDMALRFTALEPTGHFFYSRVEKIEVDVGCGRTLSMGVRVWRSVRDPDRYFVSTNIDDGRWTTHHDAAIEISAVSESGRFSEGNPVSVKVSCGAES